MSYHFIGIGGIGMSALARILHARGFHVQGSDRKPSCLIEELKAIGIKVFASHDEKHIESAKTVIYGSDIQSHHPEYAAANLKEKPLLHRACLLADLMKGYEPLLVAGTHGKTTTSALLAHTLAKHDASFAVGGLLLNYSINGYQGKGRFFVAEADESDGSFLNYECGSAILTNIEEDHLSFWKNREALIDGFKKFASKVTGHLWWCSDDPTLKEMKLQGKSYGFSPESTLQITAFSQQGWSLFFDLQMSGKTYSAVEIPLIGKHNVLNAAAVFGLCLELGLSEEEIRSAFKTFKGVKRRMEKKGEKRGVVVLDDYAHHPTEIKTTLEGVRSAAGKRRIVAIFQPHRCTRLSDCWSGFLEAFDAADRVFVTDVYGAGEIPIEGITGERFAQALQKKIPVTFAPRDQLLEKVSDYLRPHDVVITLGAGDVTYLGVLDQPFKPFRMAILQGGRSAEHEVSLMSSKRLVTALNPEFYELQTWTISKEGEWGQSFPEVVANLLSQDLVFPILHGPFGEDGTIQGFLETIGVPYVGCDFRACTLTMDKAWTKHVARSNGVAVARFIDFSIEEWSQDRESIRKKIESSFQFPFYIKASHLGSTFGVYRITKREQINSAIAGISKLDYGFLVEEEVCGREIEFGFMGDTVSDGAEVVRSADIHTYENKYSLSGNPAISKAPMPPEVLQKGRRAAQTVYRATGCSSLARIDFFLKEDGEWILNEVNPMPGLTPMSVYPAIWKAEGMQMAEVIDQVIIASLHRSRLHQKHLRPPELL